MVVEFTDSNFEELIQTEKLVMLDFSAPWCGPCRALAPTVNAVAADYNEKVLVGTVNVDDNPDMSEKFGIRNVPTILFLKGGEVVDKSLGAVPKNELVRMIEANL